MVGPGTGAKVSTNVDFQPWCNADFSRCDYYPQGTISMQVPAVQVEVGDTVTMDSLVTADGVYGMQLNVQFNATNLQFVSGTKNDVASAGWYWDFPIENFAPVSGGVRVSGTMWTRRTRTPRH